LAAQAQSVIEAALREMQGGAATSGALVAEQAEMSASAETMIEPADNPMRSPGV
jgi:1-acyl-sn-glycerol-3-phosphate acyltransferase